MTINTPASGKYSKELEHGMSRLKQYADAVPENDWKFLSEKNGVKLYSKKPDDQSEPMIYRGDYLYKCSPDLRPVDTSTASIFASSRRIYDSRFETSDLRVVQSRYSSISYAQSKPVWPITPRDFSTLTLREVSDDVAYFGIFSVVDDEINPPVEGFVRGNLVCTGWKFMRVAEGMHMTFINQMDLCGSVPTAVSKSALQQMPTCAAKLAQYIDKYGFPPATEMVDTLSGAEFLGENFDHFTATYTVHFNGDGATTTQAEIRCSDQMFSKGFKVVIEGKGQYVTVPSPSSQTVQISHVSGPVTVQIIGNKKNK